VEWDKFLRETQKWDKKVGILLAIINLLVVNLAWTSLFVFKSRKIYNLYNINISI
jgi:hypothetical protein